MIETTETLPPVHMIYQDTDTQREFSHELFEEREVRRVSEAIERFLELLAGQGQNTNDRIPTTDAHSPRELELWWLADHPEVLTEYAGQWIALEGAALVAADPKLSVVMATAREKGIPRPLTMFIPSDPRGYWLGLSNEPVR